MRFASRLLLASGHGHPQAGPASPLAPCLPVWPPHRSDWRQTGPVADRLSASRCCTTQTSDPDVLRRSSVVNGAAHSVLLWWPNVMHAVHCCCCCPPIPPRLLLLHSRVPLPSNLSRGQRGTGHAAHRLFAQHPQQGPHFAACRARRGTCPFGRGCGACPPVPPVPPLLASAPKKRGPLSVLHHIAYAVQQQHLDPTILRRGVCGPKLPGLLAL